MEEKNTNWQHFAIEVNALLQTINIFNSSVLREKIRVNLLVRENSESQVK